MVRRAIAADAQAVAEIHIRSWQTAYDGIVPPDYLASLSDTLDRRAAWFVSHIGDGAVVHVDEHDGRPVGFVTTGISEDGKHAELFAIYVDPDHWGHGHGHVLFEAAESHLATLGRDLAVLWVLRDNHRAREFYSAHGWTDSKRSALLNIGGEDLTEVRYESQI